MHRTVVACALVLTTAALAHAEPRIINGVRTSGYPSVGALMRGPDVASADLRCSGTLIGCSTFITAAHCVCDLALSISTCGPGQAGEPNPANYWVFLPHAGIHTVASIDVHPEFAFPLGGDLAIVHLDTPVTGVVPTPINLTAEVVPGALGTIVGYGRGDAIGTDLAGLKREGAVQTARCRSGVPNTTSVCWTYEAPFGPPGTDSDTCSGDSGGPLFVDFGCGRTLAGVTSGGYGDAKCVPPTHGFDTAVYNARDWVATHAGGDLGGNSCGALRPVGASGTTVEHVLDEITNADREDVHAFTVAPGVASLRITFNSESLPNIPPPREFAVRAGAPPDATTFDCRHDGLSGFAACEFPNPTPGTWYVRVTRPEGNGIGLTYEVTATSFAAGSPDPLGATDGLACDDRNVCTSAAACSAGQCAGPPVADGAPCADLSLCTHGDACVAGTCTGSATPDPACRVPAHGSSVLLYKSSQASANRQLVWKWKSNAGSVVADFGTPNTTTPHELCIFDTQAGVPALVHRSHVPPGPLWRSSSKGWTYTDKSGQADGTTSLGLRASPTGRTTLSYKAKGNALNRPGTPYTKDPEVRVQLKNDQACWEAAYTTATGSFKAKATY